MGTAHCGCSLAVGLWRADLLFLFGAAPSMHSLFVTSRAVQAMKFVSNLDETVRAIDALEKLKITVETLAFGHL